MSNIKTELQYRIALGILGQMCSAGLVNDQEAETIRRLAAEKYRPETVRGLKWIFPPKCGSVGVAQTVGKESARWNTHFTPSRRTC